uniref:Uncharacterized protein n=2 Tax=Timema TaxID=61471 RepID=A0A7R9HTI0_9NEOP|nr:unnamed protein product [Timema monikensis]
MLSGTFSPLCTEKSEEVVCDEMELQDRFDSCESDRIQGTGHGNQINGMKSVDSFVYTCGIDDSIKQISVASKSYTQVDIKLGSQPRSMDVKGDFIVVASVKELSVVQDGHKVSVLPVSYEPSCVSFDKDHLEVAVGGSVDNKFIIKSSLKMKLFTDSPARRALFTQLTGCTTFPLKFCGVRWLENVKCFQRALQICYLVVKFLKEAKLPKTKPVETLKRAACDPFLKCKPAFCKTIADECQPFLERFQTSKPMTPYLFEAVEKLLRYLMNRCVKPDLMKCTGPKLLSIDTKKSENLILSKNIDIGFATKRLLGETAITVTERQKLEFIHECRSMLTTMIAKLQEKSPLKQKAVRGLSSLDPCVIQHSPQLAQKRFSFLLEELNHANIINDVLAENAKKEYLHFCNLKKSELQEIFRPCDQFSDEVGLDTIYGSFLIGDANYKHLWEVIKICLVLSHGNATVEGGFSVNKSLLVENMHEKTVTAQRHIHDEIQEAGGIKNIHISKKMLDYMRGARRRYHEYLEMKKQERSEEDKKAEKRKLDIQVHIYTLSGTSLVPKQELEHLGPLTDCAYSPDNKFLVACDANRKVILYQLPDYQVISLESDLQQHHILLLCTLVMHRLTRDTSFHPVMHRLTRDTSFHPVMHRLTRDTSFHPVMHSLTRDTSFHPVMHRLTRDTSFHPVMHRLTHDTSFHPVMHHLTRDTSFHPVMHRLTRDTSFHPVMHRLTRDTSFHPVVHRLTRDTSFHPVMHRLTRDTSFHPVMHRLTRDTSFHPVMQWYTNN